MTELAEIVEQGIQEQDVALIKAAILEKYGFEVTDEYAADFIRFVADLIEEQEWLHAEIPQTHDNGE